MASGETLPRGGASHHAGTGPNPATGQIPGTGRGHTVTGVVVVAHGGQASSTEPTAATQPAVLRMVPIAAAIRHALRGSGAVVLRPRFGLRGWNGDRASPVDDLNQALDGIVSAYRRVPIVLIGRSMGARAAMRAAAHPAVLRPQAWLRGCPRASRWSSLPDGGCSSRTGPPTVSPTPRRPRPTSSARGRSPGGHHRSARRRSPPCCAAPASGTPSRPNSPALPLNCRPGPGPPGQQDPSPPRSGRPDQEPPRTIM